VCWVADDLAQFLMQGVQLVRDVGVFNDGGRCVTGKNISHPQALQCIHVSQPPIPLSSPVFTRSEADHSAPQSGQLSGVSASPNMPSW
jgi:hypothetical protein